MEFIFDPSLVLYLPLWKLDGANIRSEDARGHLCTINGATLYPRRGRFFTVGDSDFIDCGRSVAFDFGIGDFTLIAYINTSNSATVGTVMGKGFARRYNCTINANGTIVFNLDDVDNEFQIAAGIEDAVNDGSWHHLAFVADRDGEGIIYKNGNNIKSGALTATTTITDTTKDFTIGIFSGNETSNPFDGTIGEVWVYNRALTPLEV
ncbi:hypothetical protein LCGC14_2651760, partial [marine sediment metagenome]